MACADRHSFSSVEKEVGARREGRENSGQREEIRGRDGENDPWRGCGGAT